LRTGWDRRRRIVIGRILIVWAYRFVVVAVLVVIVIFVAFRWWLIGIVGAIAVVGCRRGCGGIVVLALRALLAFAVLHLSLLKQSTLLGSLLAFRAVLDLV
jgi:hypothetical protein